MKTFPHVEDYLELLSNQDYSWIMTSKPRIDVVIKLARYDVSVVNNMVDNVMWGVALTDRQADLAIKLILKYRRQFAKYDIDVSPVAASPSFRMPLRKIDRSRSLRLENGQLNLRFPYDAGLIEQIREFQRNSQGAAKWDNSTKVWAIALTEYNINYIATWALNNQFEVGSEVLEIYEKIIATEKTPYDIKLVEHDDGKYSVTNAAASLQEYIDQNIGNNLVKLIDHSGVLGYSVDASLLAKAAATYGQPLVDIGTQHSAVLSPDMESLRTVIDYAKITRRFPICIYDPSMFDLDLDFFPPEEIIKFDHNGKTSTSNYNPNDAKIVYARKIPNNWSWPVPLLVSTAEMMYGGR